MYDFGGGLGEGPPSSCRPAPTNGPRLDHVAGRLERGDSWIVACGAEPSHSGVLRVLGLHELKASSQSSQPPAAARATVAWRGRECALH